MISVFTFVLLLLLIEGGIRIMAAIDDMTTAVTNLEAASVTIINDLTALKAAGNDSAALEALVGRVNTVTQNLTTAASS